MIIQKEVKFSLGLMVIFILLAAAIFVYKGEEGTAARPPEEGPVAVAGAGGTGEESVPPPEEEAAPSPEPRKEPGEESSVISITDEEEPAPRPEPAVEEPALPSPGPAEPPVPEPTVKTEPEPPVPETGPVVVEEEQPSRPEPAERKPAERKETVPIPPSLPEAGSLEAKPTPAPPAETYRKGGTEYVIKPGDTFSKIAARVYGKASLFHLLEKANPHIVPTEMMPGEKIIIPPYTPPKKEKKPASRVPSPSLPADRVYYTVKRGDTLSGIAKKFYGTTAKWEDILKANADKIQDEYNMPAGLVILIPGITPAETPSAAGGKKERKKEGKKTAPETIDIPDLTGLPSAEEAEKGSAEKKKEIIHVVRPGESLWSIAETYYSDGTKFKLLAKANPSIHPDRLLPGQKIRIPGAAVAAPKPGGTGGPFFVYTVREGDYLAGIAEELLGSAARWRDIAALNPGLNPHRIYPGQKIKIPGRGPKTEAEETSLPEIPRAERKDQFLSSPSGGRIYVVKPGDTLSGIAHKVYGSTRYVKKILEANPRIPNEDTLFVGMKLRLPDIPKAGAAPLPAGGAKKAGKTGAGSWESFLGGGKKEEKDDITLFIEKELGR